jgi:uncharacterized membrane protein
MLLVGSLMIFAGLARAALEALLHGPSTRIPQEIVTHAALGLEFFVGAGILNLVLNPTWAVVSTVAVTIVTRKLLTLSLNRLARAN